MSENTERAIKNGQSRETGNKTKKNKTKTQHNMCWTPLSCKQFKIKETNGKSIFNKLHHSVEKYSKLYLHRKMKKI